MPPPDPLRLGGGGTFTIQYSHAQLGSVAGVVALGGGALGLAPAVIGALSGFSVGATQTALANVAANVLPGVRDVPWHAGVVQSAFVGAMGGAVAGGVTGAIKPQSLAARMAVGGLVGGGVSGGTQVAINVATGRPWDEGLGQAISVGLTTGTLDAFMDYYGDQWMEGQLGKRPVRSLAEDADRGPWKPSLREFAGRLLTDEGGYFAPWLDADDATAARLRNLDEFTGEPTGLRGDDLRRALADAGGGRGGLSGRLAEARDDLPNRALVPYDPEFATRQRSSRRVTLYHGLTETRLRRFQEEGLQIPSFEGYRGAGLYLTPDVEEAALWAARYEQKNYSVLRFDVDASAFEQLTGVRTSWRESVDDIFRPMVELDALTSQPSLRFGLPSTQAEFKEMIGNIRPDMSEYPLMPLDYLHGEVPVPGSRDIMGYEYAFKSRRAIQRVLNNPYITQISVASATDLSKWVPVSFPFRFD